MPIGADMAAEYLRPGRRFMQQIPLEGVPQMRADLDQYFTPPWLAERMVRWGIEGYRASFRGDQPIAPPMILEPGAGQGSIVAPGLKAGSIVIAYEADPGHARHMRERFADAKTGTFFLRESDFLSHGDKFTADLAIMNPPYTADVAFVARALLFADRAIALLRTIFLNGSSRWHAIWRNHYLARVAHLISRPVFGGEWTPKKDFSVFDIRRYGSGPTEVSWW